MEKRTPRTMPVGKTIPHARICMRMCAHSIESYSLNVSTATRKTSIGRTDDGIRRDALAFGYAVRIVIVSKRSPGQSQEDRRDCNCPFHSNETSGVLS